MSGEQPSETDAIERWQTHPALRAMSQACWRGDRYGTAYAFAKLDAEGWKVVLRDEPQGAVSAAEAGEQRSGTEAIERRELRIGFVGGYDEQPPTHLIALTHAPSGTVMNEYVRADFHERVVSERDHYRAALKSLVEDNLLEEIAAQVREALNLRLMGGQ